LWLEVEAEWRWSGGGAEVVWHGVEVEWEGVPLKSTSLKRGMHAVEWSGVERHGMEWWELMWNGAEWNGVEQNAMVWRGMEWSRVEVEWRWRWSGME
jgi:hypothetical protein